MVQLADSAIRTRDFAAYTPGTHAEFREWVTSPEVPEGARFTYVNGG